MSWPNLLNAVTTTSDTSKTPTNVENMTSITFAFTCVNHTSGNGVFTVFGTVDNINYFALNFIDLNVANTNAQNPTRVASATLNSNTTKAYALDQFIGLKAIYFAVAVTTDGAYSVSMQANKMVTK